MQINKYLNVIIEKTDNKSNYSVIDNELNRKIFSSENYMVVFYFFKKYVEKKYRRFQN